ncbi:MAG TPA: hypothetical protein PKC43_08240 [Phycisphaerales bacterium]|nr:hypothetical protein [Phycisphaerales bacterium]HMP37425.1 hypothetical protein [Phycisphaerales bacterium]
MIRVVIRRRSLLALLGYAALVAAAFALAWMFGAGRFREDAGARAEEQARGVLLSVRELRERRPAIEEGLGGFVSRTLGDSIAKVDGEIRARLNQLGAEEGLGQLVVTTTTTTARDSPAKSRYGRGADQKPLRDEIDFVEVSASISGEGTPMQVFRLLQRIDAEPWLKRIDGVRLDTVRGARASEETRLRAAIRLTTLFVPGRSSEATIASSWTPAELERLAPILDRLPFAPPRRAVAAEPERPPPPPVQRAEPPPAFAYEEWLLTGVATGPLGAEAWLANRLSGEGRILRPGESLHEMVLADASGGEAVFTLAGERVAIEIGRRMTERRRIE